MNCIDPRLIWPHRSVDYDGKEKSFLVPCGKCLPCLINRRTDWSFRLQEEHKVAKSSMFVTLTYDPKHCPSDGSLCKKHFQDFMKRLRKRDGSNTLRYFAVGEYGSKSLRPHYHALLFNANEVDVRSAWCDSKSRPIGMVHIGKVTGASIAYCLKYMVQPEIWPQHLEKPFSLMSRRYGIGAHYLSDEMIEWHRSGDRNYTLKYGEHGRLPRFYREKIWPSVKPKVPFDDSRYVRQLIARWQFERERVSKAAMELVLVKQRNEDEFYKVNYGSRADKVKADHRDAALSRVKVKVAFSQKF